MRGAALALATVFGVPIAALGQPAPSGPPQWVAFAADVHIQFAKGTEAWGREVQDEHGCVRHDMVHPDGSAIITILNFQPERMYQLMHGAWKTQPMKMGPQPHPPTRLRVTRRTDPVDGFDAYISEIPSHSPKGDSIDIVTVVPALNYFRAAYVTLTGERRTATNIHVGPQSHDQFLPPPGAIVTEQPGYGGFMSFAAVVLRLSFVGQPPLEATTIEETAFAITTPAGIPLTLVTGVTDPATHAVRVRVLANAAGSPGNVRGDQLDEVSVPLGGTAQTTRLGETLTITVTRVGTAVAR
jgi:hypothetical protein